MTAIVEASKVLTLDQASWHHLLSEKGSQMSSKTLQEDFCKSFELECGGGNGLTEDRWTALMSQRRSELGIRVNSFNKDVENFIKQIPDPAEIFVLANVIAISKAISEEDKDADSDAYSDKEADADTSDSDAYRDKEADADTLDVNDDDDRDKDDVRAKHSEKKPYSVRFIHC